ncbi:MAG: M3 family metallopeptidase [Bacteroidales bacterium]|nr:M3 family metallopeptidase [Bacteroidales bacterium]
MKKLIIIALAALALMTSCDPNARNPFFAETWNTPFGTPPFDQIRTAHYMPAFLEGMRRHNAEIEAIINNSEAPTFENTIVAFEASGLFLERVELTFRNFIRTDRNAGLTEVEREILPMLSSHFDRISMNAELFERIRYVYENERGQLYGEDERLLYIMHRNFVRGGAMLDEASQARLKEINEELTNLTSQFNSNVMAEQNAFYLHITDEAQLSGLPPAVVAAAAALAEREGKEGWLWLSLQRSVFTPLLTFLDCRDLRYKVWSAYVNKGTHDNEFNNEGVATNIANLRLEKAQLFGYETAGAFILGTTTARYVETVQQFLTDLWIPTQRMFNREARMLQDMIYARGGDFELQPWDWRYYAEIVRQVDFGFDETAFREYLKLENVINAAFDLTTRLWGVTWEERFDIPKFNPENRVWLMRDYDGTELGILFADYHPRPSKQGGAWMGYFRQQSGWPHNNVLPVVLNISNYTAPSGDQPALLSIDEANTLFHEIGHALHMLFSRTYYRSLSGTNVKLDFVEMPSSLMENWAFEPEFLRTFAKHYRTGEVVSDEMIEQMQRAAIFNMGFITGEFLASAWVDFFWYTVTEPITKGAVEFELAAMAHPLVNLAPQLKPRHRSTYFLHIFSSMYHMGYYSYYWCEVLDADIFQAFVESGDLFNREVAAGVRRMFEQGGTVDPADIFREFRGRDPRPEPFLRRRGLL